MPEMTFTPEEVAFYKRYKLPLPKTPTMVDPFELEGKMRASGLAGNKNITVNKDGKKLDARKSAFDEILDVVTEGQATGVPKMLPNGDVDTGKRFIGQHGNDRYTQRKLMKQIWDSPEPVIKKPDGTYTFMDAESNAIRKLSEPLYASKSPADVNRRVQLESGQEKKPIDVKGVDKGFYDTFFPEHKTPDLAPPPDGTTDAVAPSNKTATFDTVLTPVEEEEFKVWKQQYAPRDSGADYDLRGAFKEGLKPDAETGHWPDTYKKPNHPTFSVESRYAKDAPEKAGHWEGEVYVPPSSIVRAPPVAGVDVAPVSGFDQFKDLIEQGKVGMPDYPSEGARQTAAGALGVPGETVYGTIGMGLKGAELAADYVNRKVAIKNQSLSNLITGQPTSHFDFGSKYYFEKAGGVTRAAEATTGAKPIKDVNANFFRNLGASVPFLGSPLVAISGTLIGTAIGDLVFDLSDPKYESLPDLYNRKPSNKKPELQPYAETGMVEGDEPISSVYQNLGAWPWIIIGAAATLGGYRTIRQAFKIPTPRITRMDPALQPERPSPLPEGFVPELELGSATKPGVSLQTMHQDATAIVKAYSKRAAGQRANDAATLHYIDEVNTQTHVAGQETAAATVKTGRYITPTRIIEAPAPFVLREAHRNLPPERQELFNQGMLAADKLDDLNNGKSAFHVGMTVEDANAKIALMRADPVLANMEREYRKATGAALDFMVDSGLIDPMFRTTLTSARPGFMPNISIDNAIDQPIWQQFKDAIIRDPGTQDDAFRMLPTLHRRDEEVGMRNFVPPMDALMAYVQHMVQFTNHNRLRRKLLTDMLHSSDPTVAASVRQVIPGRNTPNPVQENRTTGYYVNGEKMKYEVGDPMLAKALEFAPNTALFPTMNGFRKYTQFFLTANNPYFAPMVFLREATQSGVFRPKDRTFGYVDKAVKYATGGRMGYRGDLTGMIGSLTAIPMDLIPRAALNLSQNIHSNLMIGNKPFWGALDGMFGAGSSLAVADRMRNSYITSMRGVLDAMGGYNVKMTQYGINESASAIEKSASAWESRFGSSATRAFKGYQAAIESLHNASRLFFFSQNFTAGMSLSDIRKLAAETQNLTGDLRKAGLGASSSKLEAAHSTNESIRRGLTNALNNPVVSRVGRFGVESSLYGNPMIQGLAKIGNMLKTDPSGFGMGLFNVLAVPTVASLVMGAYLDHDDPDAGYLDYYFNRRPEWDKVTSIPVFIPGMKPELSPKVQIDPTLGVFAYGTASIIDQIVSARDWNPTLNEFGMAVPPANQMVRRSAKDEGAKQVWSALGAVVGMNLPMPMSLYLAMNGFDTFNAGGPGYGGIYKQQEEQLSGGGGITGKKEPDNVLPMWAQSLVVEAHGSMGAFATAMLDAGVAGYDEGGVKTAMDAIQIQAQMEAIKGFRFAAPVTGFHQEYASRESDIKYEKQRAADNLADVISAQINHPGEIRAKPASGVDGVISDDAMKGLNTYVASSGTKLQPIKNEVFAQMAPLIYDTVAKGPIKDVINALSVVRKQQKDLRSVNAGNLHLFPELRGAKGPLKSLMDIQTRINELELIKRQLNIKYIEIISELEQKVGMKLEDIDPYKEVKLPPQMPQQPGAGAAPPLGAR